MDDSSGSDGALAFAARQAVLEGGELRLLHALPGHTPARPDPDPVGRDGARELGPRARGQQVLDHARRQVDHLAPDLRVLELLRLDDPREALLELSEGASMVVVGSRGRGHLRSLLLGSTSVALVRHAHCPVVVHRRASASTSRHGIAVATDATSDSLPVLDFAYRQARVHGLELTVVHCWYFQQPADDADPSPGRTTEEHRLALVRSLAGLTKNYPDVAVHTVVEQGMPERRLMALAEGMELLVVGQHHGSRASQFMFGSMSVWLVEHAPCSVAVVPLGVQ